MTTGCHFSQVKGPNNASIGINPRAERVTRAMTKPLGCVTNTAGTALRDGPTKEKASAASRFNASSIERNHAGPLLHDQPHQYERKSSSAPVWRKDG